MSEHAYDNDCFCGNCCAHYRTIYGHDWIHPLEKSMLIHNGDHADFELTHANTKPEDRPDWPLPSFDAQDWAKAFCKRFPTFDEGTALAWFANALMRGFDEATMRADATRRIEPVEVTADGKIVG